MFQRCCSCHVNSYHRFEQAFLCLAQQHFSSAENWKIVPLDIIKQILACVIIQKMVSEFTTVFWSRFTIIPPKQWNAHSKNSLCKPKQLPDANPLTQPEQWQLNKSASALHTIITWLGLGTLGPFTKSRIQNKVLPAAPQRWIENNSPVMDPYPHWNHLSEPMIQAKSVSSQVIWQLVLSH